ncbi:putative damage-inducible protein DinB [Catalinimonas alkaloidigena]|uniref:DinB family protein n=1 Tax=Catalinimonas alkaloidigena TaxID=1075417 RepID=UPI00240530C9|nr:DinB family protein [Catalinimonas alkaloidigena]MDF9800992.1 putative damage-inducible protein DinB [Catalinimonas alkaloidigena]
MENSSIQQKETASNVVITPEALLEQWQGHRRLTRRVIEAFPEKELFNFSVGGMRPFAALAMEMIGIAGPGMRGIVSRKWENIDVLMEEAEKNAPQTKEGLLQRWDETTEEINRLWPQIPANRFQEVDKAFGQYEGPIYWNFFYFVDNEIHHRGQGYVYLRALGITPPFFWER